MYIKLYDYMDTQHALFIQSWQKELDESGFARAILMDLSKAYDCLPHDVMLLN